MNLLSHATSFECSSYPNKSNKRTRHFIQDHALFLTSIAYAYFTVFGSLVTMKNKKEDNRRGIGNKLEEKGIQLETQVVFEGEIIKNKKVPRSICTLTGY